MKTGQKPILQQAMASIVGWAMAAGLGASVSASSVTVTDVTDWGTTPMEVVNTDLTYLGYNGGVYARINTLSVQNGANTTMYGGFCIDPFHWSASGPVTTYSIVPLVDGPKSPATLNAFTATEIEDLWQEYYSPTMSSPSAAALQVAIWELVSSNAVANDNLAPQYAFALDAGQSDFGASLDLASLATYHGPAADLVALTGPGQDYVINTGGPPIPPPSIPDGGATFMMLALTLGALVIARPALTKCVGQRLKMQAIPVDRRCPRQG